MSVWIKTKMKNKESKPNSHRKWKPVEQRRIYQKSNTKLHSHCLLHGVQDMPPGRDLVENDENFK